MDKIEDLEYFEDLQRFEEFERLENFLFLDELPFLQVYQYCRTNPCPDEYWRHRIRLYTCHRHVDPGVKLDPDVAYAWAATLSSDNSRSDPLINKRCREGPDFIRGRVDGTIPIFLFTRKNLLFYGFEYLIGSNTFLLRAIEQDNEPMVKYITSAFDSYLDIPMAIAYSVELNRESIARHLSNSFDDWTEYNARYLPSPTGPIGLSDLQFKALVKYGKIGYDADHVAAYLSGLAERGAVKELSYTVDPSVYTKMFVQIIDSLDILHGSGKEGRASMIAKSLGVGGNMEMIDSFLKEAHINMLTNTAVEELMMVASRRNNIAVASDVLGMVKDVNLTGLTIRTSEMYNLLVERTDMLTEKNRLIAVLYGNNIYIQYEKLIDLVRLVSSSMNEIQESRVSKFMWNLLVDIITSGLA